MPDRIDLTSAEHGYYVLRSDGTTVYVIEVPSFKFMRIAGSESQQFGGEDEWHRLSSFTSGPDLRVETPDPHDVMPWVVRVGSRHRFEWDPGLLHPYEWRLGRVVESIDGPLTREALSNMLKKEF